MHAVCMRLGLIFLVRIRTDVHTYHHEGPVRLFPAQRSCTSAGHPAPPHRLLVDHRAGARACASWEPPPVHQGGRAAARGEAGRGTAINQGRLEMSNEYITMREIGEQYGVS